MSEALAGSENGKIEVNWQDMACGTSAFQAHVKIQYRLDPLANGECTCTESDEGNQQV